MKKVFIILIFTFISFSNFAQDNKIELGIESGANIGIYNQTYTKQIPKIGVLFGGSIQWNINKTISLRSGFIYEKIGFYEIKNIIGNNANSLGTAKFNSDLYYYRLPLLLRANFGNKTKFFINAGANISTLSKSRYYAKSEIINKDLTIKGNLKDINFGFTAGTGLSIPISEKINTSFEVRYNTTEQKINSLNGTIGLSYNL